MALTKDTLFRTPSRAEQKQATTDSIARSIVDAETAAREAKSERLRKARLEREAAEREAAAERPAAKPRARAKSRRG